MCIFFEKKKKNKLAARIISSLVHRMYCTSCNLRRGTQSLSNPIFWCEGSSISISFAKLSLQRRVHFGMTWLNCASERRLIDDFISAMKARWVWPKTSRLRTKNRPLPIILQIMKIKLSKLINCQPSISNPTPLFLVLSFAYPKNSKRTVGTCSLSHRPNRVPKSAQSQ